jgi:uncharacterized protein (DUF2147 family)
MPRKIFLIVLVLAFAPMSSAFAADVLGEWARDDGRGSVRFTRCGNAVCGTTTAKSDPNGPGKIGQQVFFDMKPSGEGVWQGTAFNPDDGRQYSGKMSLAGDRLTTAGCALGGLICKSVTWRKIR